MQLVSSKPYNHTLICTSLCPFTHLLLLAMNINVPLYLYILYIFVKCLVSNVFIMLIRDISSNVCLRCSIFSSLSFQYMRLCNQLIYFFSDVLDTILLQVMLSCNRKFIRSFWIRRATMVTTVWFTTFMMTSSNGNIFRVTGPLCGEFTGPGEFPAQRPVTRSFDVYFDLRPN